MPENAVCPSLPVSGKLRKILAQMHDRSKKKTEQIDKGEGDQDA